mmetsp:Transcript_176718/g.566736  ORF Transcript_176718/g.566736 Transcript_176718/m.566736 type:complete len:1695 (-) Transcript_176718:73-5157(-)
MSALILVDCASSGSKMYLALQRSVGGFVSNVEIGSLPSVEDSLHQLHQGLSGPDNPAENALFSGFRDCLQPAFDETFRLRMAPEVPVRAVVVGLTSFWRMMSYQERTEAFKLLFIQLRQIVEEVASVPCLFEPLSENWEAQLARRAVEYAVLHSSLTCKSADLVVSGGNSCVEFTPPKDFKAPPVTVGLSLKKGKDVIRDQGIEVWQTECLVQVDRAAGVYCGELAAESPEEIQVIAIGSIYWGGKFAGLDGEHSLQEVLRTLTHRLQAAVHALEDSRSPLSRDRSPRSPVASQDGLCRDIANLIRVQACFERLFPVHLRGKVCVVFRRDWDVGGESFRTTWTSGYFVRYCVDAGLAFTRGSLRNLLWTETDPSREDGWLDLSSEESVHLSKILVFEDAEDHHLHEVSYSRRIDAFDIMPTNTHSFPKCSPGDLIWSRVALGETAIGLDEGQHLGVEVLLPSADGFASVVVVGFVSCRDTLGRHSPNHKPCPALGYNRRIHSKAPVVDMGFSFDAKAATVCRTRGASMNADLILGSSDNPWDREAEATYHMWIERCSHDKSKFVMRFAQDGKVPLTRNSDGGTVEEWRYEFDETMLSLPAALQVWVGVTAGAQDEHLDASWTRLTVKSLPKMPNTWNWAWARSMTKTWLAVSRLTNSMQAQLPNWLADSFTPLHDGTEGVRRLAVWPPQGTAIVDASHGDVPGLVVTAGEREIWIFSDQGRGLYRCSCEKATVFSIGILGVQRIPSSFFSSKTSLLEVRLVIGCTDGDMKMLEQTIVVDDPSARSSCTLKEQTIPSEDFSAQNIWYGHTDHVTGIFVDHARGLVYTVSYDKTAIQWDFSGRKLCEARGFHSMKIYHGALSPGGCWLATAAFDHVALFSADLEKGLTCAAFIDHSWDHLDIDRRWFAVAFMPRSFDYDEVESVSELPSVILTGDMIGNTWLVSLLQPDGTRRSSEGQTAFISASISGMPLCSHQGVVRQLCWIEAPSLSRPGQNAFSGSVKRSRCCCGGHCCCKLWRSSSEFVSGSGPGARELSLPLLCSMSSDKTIRVFDSKDLQEAYEHLKKGGVKVSAGGRQHLHMQEPLPAAPSRQGFSFWGASSPSSSSGNIFWSDSKGAGTEPDSPGLAPRAKSVAAYHFGGAEDASPDSKKVPVMQRSKSAVEHTATSSSTKVGRRNPAMRISESILLANRDAIPYALEIPFHTGPVRAAAVDAHGRLYTGCRRIAQWDGLQEYRFGDVVLQPKLLIREAYFPEVVMYFANIIAFSLQLLYFSSNRGVFADSDECSACQLTVSPVAVTGQVSVLDLLSRFNTAGVWPFTRTCFALLVALMVCVCPQLLRTFYDAEKKYEKDELDLASKKKFWRRKIVCYLLSFVLFSLMVVATFQEFAVLLSCPKGADGIRRMTSDLSVICFEGTHLAMTIFCFVLGTFYLACGLLFETVNFELRSFMESKLGNEAAFPVSSRFACGRNVTLCRLYYVMFWQLLPGSRLGLPKVDAGVFTETEWAVSSRQVRFLSKVLLVVADQSWYSGRFQMVCMNMIAFANLLVILIWPPLVDTRLMRFLRVLTTSTFLAGATALVALSVPRDVQPALAGVYVFLAFLPVLYILPNPCLHCARRMCARAGMAAGKEPHPLLLTGSGQRDLRLAWEHVAGEAPGSSRVRSGLRTSGLGSRQPTPAHGLKYLEGADESNRQQEPIRLG